VAWVVEVSSTRIGSEAVPRPGPVRSRSGFATAVPEVSDGGAASWPVPHFDGDEPMVKSSVAPSASSECGSDVEPYALPLTFSDWT
jgi:hypothetical protein